ncbi:glycerophosphodiester phosphodiesterase domain-containing protein 4 [Physeter macrocephalus]|uniref:Glycerophosphodiester phosphodiesterase domain-containing protein 4 n=1 Tax=Physeter macrocephalus TaxID=9755 RepID=A0A2Y9T8V5_PHYMC|nr:glycerophosphodiester phosphodiesterase domain-containing protein 4 [Physeter catodon]|eukprot:XP_023987366.1 glycerophosphodiester phosphodiesterase domain-containing protein 4 [Physeter catodon]
MSVIFLGTGFWFFWSIVLLSFFGILAAYTSLLLVLGSLLLWEEIELYLHWCHKILILLVILTCSFFFWILLTYWKDRWLTVGLSLQVFAPYIHLSSISVMVMLSWPVAFYLIHLEGEGRIRRYQMTCYERKRNKRCNVLIKLRALQVAIGVPFFLILLCLYLLPLGIYSPCIQEKDKLGPKPNFFGHRGAPMLGPENTMMAFEKAVEHGAFGLESDVQMSYDHVPFLMHDSDLRRTTNINEVLPNASLTHPSLFDWDFLSTLNAGKWFSHPRFKPFYNMKPLSEADREKAGNQKIPKLTELLELAQKEKKSVIFDLNAPAPRHFHRSSYVRHVVSVILDSKIEQHLIFWLPGFDREYVRKRAPGFQQVSQLFSIERLTKENISRINVDYKRLFYSGLREYKAVNININLYIVNEPWLFSLAWCSSIHSVTTDNIQVLNEINHPYFFMTPSYYKFMWILMDCVSAVFIVAIFYFLWWRESQKEKLLKSTGIHTGKPILPELSKCMRRLFEYLQEIPRRGGPSLESGKEQEDWKEAETTVQINSGQKNMSKMKKERNDSQLNNQENSPERSNNEVDVSSLPDPKFKKESQTKNLLELKSELRSVSLKLQHLDELRTIGKSAQSLESQSISLRTGKSENQEPSHISIDPPTRVMEIPWIQAALYPTLTKSVRKHPNSSCFSIVPMKKASKPEQVSKTIKTPMPGKDDVRQLVPTMKAFEPTQAPIWESTRETPLQTSLSAIETNETISSVDIPHPEKQIEKPPSIESSEESSFMFSTTSSLSFFSLGLSSKKD